MRKFSGKMSKVKRIVNGAEVPGIFTKTFKRTSNEISVATVPGCIVYVLLWDGQGRVYDAVNTTFTKYETKDRDNFSILLLEYGSASGVYHGSFPVEGNGAYVYRAYIQEGDKTSESDILVNDNGKDNMKRKEKHKNEQ